MHLVVILGTTADDICHLLRGFRVGDGGGNHGKIQIVEWNVSMKKWIILEGQESRVVAHGCEETVAGEGAVTDTHGGGWLEDENEMDEMDEKQKKE